LKDMKIDYDEDNETIHKKIFIYIERSDNPCYGKNGRSHKE